MLDQNVTEQETDLRWVEGDLGGRAAVIIPNMPQAADSAIISTKGEQLEFDQNYTLVESGSRQDPYDLGRRIILTADKFSSERTEARLAHPLALAYSLIEQTGLRRSGNDLRRAAVQDSKGKINGAWEQDRVREPNLRSFSDGVFKRPYSGDDDVEFEAEEILSVHINTMHLYRYLSTESSLS